jgi:(p)ppGpp synthase/HD superfamily hydrolase
MENSSGFYSPRLTEAFDMACNLHSNQLRKGTEIPYISHLLGVAALVLEAGGDEDQFIAALLHDAPEDQGGKQTLIEINSKFGEEVANIVEDCTDTLIFPKPPWRLRKEKYLDHLKNIQSKSRLVSLADKLHNARSILSELKLDGLTIFTKFNGGKEGTLWYYTQLVSVFREVDDNYLTDELTIIVDQIIRLVKESEE